MKRIGLLLLLTITLVFLILPISSYQVQGQAEYPEFHVFIAGPDQVPVDSVSEYTITMFGGPGEDEINGSWSYSTSLDFEESRAGALIPLEMESGASRNNVFTIDLNSSTIPQKIWLTVNGSSVLNETNFVYTEITKEIQVYVPVVVNISARLRNNGGIDVENVNVSFYIDGDFIGSQFVTVNGNSSKTTYRDWTAPYDSDGEHTVKVIIGEGNDFIELEGGDNAIQKMIYIGERPKVTLPLREFYHTGLVTLLGVIGFFTALGSFFMWRSSVKGYGQYGTRMNYFMYFLSIILPVSGVVVFTAAYLRYANFGYNDSTGKGIIDGVIILTLGILTLLFTFDRVRKRRF
jgi:hypothetical protein